MRLLSGGQQHGSDKPRAAACARKAGERGSAMLIVFLFAAVVAIMLYRELPVSMFEAQRQKEQLLVDRGHEYIRAVQLFYRRNRGQYPASIDQLENTNGIRFLRHRFKDPLTGKVDWRLLHAAGPGGQLIDSKVNPLGANGTNLNSGTGQGAFGSNGAGQSPFGQSSSGQSTGFGQSGFGQSVNTSGDALPEVVVPSFRQRPPAVLASGSGTQSTPTSADLDQNPATPLLASTDPGVQPNASQSGNGQQGPGAAAGTAPNGNQQGPNVMQSLQPLLTSGITGQQQQAGFGQNGQNQQNGQGQMLGGGALAGVASKAAGHTIKHVNDQTNYSLWEFYYDPSKDKAVGTGSAGGGLGSVPTSVNGQNTNSNNGANNNSGLDNNSPINAGSSAGQSSDSGSGNTFSSPSGSSGRVSGPPAQPVPFPPAQSQ